MKCVRIADWLEKHGEEAPGGEWENLLVHTRSCPDCALTLRHRSQLLEALKSMPEPEIPTDLKQNILAQLELGTEPNEERPPIFDRLIDLLLPPLQLAVAGACIFFFVGVLFNPHSRQPSDQFQRLRIAAAKPAPARKSTSLPLKGESLVRLSDEEIAAFMKNLQDYRRLHPEMNTPTEPFVPSELAGFNQ